MQVGLGLGDDNLKVQRFTSLGHLTQFKGERIQFRGNGILKDMYKFMGCVLFDDLYAQRPAERVRARGFPALSDKRPFGFTVLLGGSWGFTVSRLIPLQAMQ